MTVLYIIFIYFMYNIFSGNIYRVENHSTYKTCTIYWTIIKPIAESIPTEGDY